MKIVAKFQCQSVTRNHYKDEVTKFTAATGPGNESWSQYTPSGELSIAITNPEAQGKFEPGVDYLLTFEPAPAKT